MRILAPLVAVILVLVGCQRNPPPQPVAEYQMRGEVLRLDPAGQLAAVKHGKIEGWMEAMTMDYPVRDKQDFAKLRVGEKIQAKVSVHGHDYWISDIAEDAVK